MTILNIHRLVSALLVLLSLQCCSIVVFVAADEEATSGGETVASSDAADAAADVSTVTTATAAGTIEGRLQFVDARPFNETTRITLNHGEFTTYSRLHHNSTFVFHNVPPGIHVLDVHHTKYHFSQVKCQLLEEEGMVPKCLEYYYPGANKQPVKSYPLVLSALATYEYFEKRSGFSVFAILKNPMVLMMAFSLGMMFLMPKMMEGMDPEEKERMKRQMAAQQDPTKMLSELFGGLGGGEESSALPPSQPAAAATKKGKK